MKIKNNQPSKIEFEPFCRKNRKETKKCAVQCIFSKGRMYKKTLGAEVASEK